MFTMRPNPRSSIPGSTARSGRYVPPTLIAMLRSQSAGSERASGAIGSDHAGAVHEDRRRADPARGRERELAHLTLVADVGGLRERVTTGALDDLHHLVELRRVARREHDRGAKRRERLRHGAAQPAASSGDDRDLADEKGHGGNDNERGVRA